LYSGDKKPSEKRECSGVKISNSSELYVRLKSRESPSQRVSNALAMTPEVGLLRCGSFEAQGEIAMLLRRVNSGLRAGYAPKRTPTGTSGVYFLYDNRGKKCAVFKPDDEEVNAPNNPRGFVWSIGSDIMGRGIPSGSGSFRELAAAMLDPTFRIPLTSIVELINVPKTWFQNNDERHSTIRVGCLQEFIEKTSTKWDPRDLPASEVHKMAVLDMLILNTDRNEGNLLVDDNHAIFLIDHALCLPFTLNLYDFDYQWAKWPQIMEPFEEDMKRFILQFDVEKYITRITKAEIKKSANPYFLIRFSDKVLKHAVKNNKTLLDISNFFMRKQWEIPSKAESILKTAEEEFAFQKVFTSKQQAAVHAFIRAMPIQDRFEAILNVQKETGLLHFLAMQAMDGMENESNDEQTSCDKETLREVREISKQVSTQMIEFLAQLL